MAIHKKDIESMGRIYDNTVNKFELKNIQKQEELELPKVEEPVRKKFDTEFKNIINKYKENE